MFPRKSPLPGELLFKKPPMNSDDWLFCLEDKRMCIPPFFTKNKPMDANNFIPASIAFSSEIGIIFNG